MYVEHRVTGCELGKGSEEKSYCKPPIAAGTRHHPAQ